MHTTSKLGIWMDHATAHIIPFSTDTMETPSIDSAATHESKEESLQKSERHMHNREQREQGEYYAALAMIIKNYTDVLLFGPTDAKQELSNVLKADHHFDNITVTTQQTDKMTEPQEHAYVKAYFS